MIMNKFSVVPGIFSLLLSGAQLTYGQNLLASDEAWTALNLKVTDELVIPGYQNMAANSVDLVNAAANFCTEISAEGLDSFKAAYHHSMADWQLIQHIQFGPITYFNWNYRLQYWPDERGTGARQLDALIGSGDESVLGSDSFARQSVGVQGLPALERILFDDNAIENFQGNPYLCLVSQTIVRNINEISSGVTQRWTDEYRAVVLDPVASGFYENAEDLSIDFLKALQEAIAKIRDLKLAPVLGDSFASSRNREAESWRSGRSLANIKINLLALQPLFLAYTTAFYEEDVAAVQAAFNDLSANLKVLPDTMSAALENEEQYGRLRMLSGQVDAVHEALEAALKNTDLYLGFNSLDGD